MIQMIFLVLSNLSVPTHAAPPNTPEMVLKGKALYSQNCLSCHGEKGDGQGPAGKYLVPVKPRNFTKDKFKNGTSEEQLFNTITNGLDGTAMASYKNTIPNDGDRWALAFYVETFIQKK